MAGRYRHLLGGGDDEENDVAKGRDQALIAQLRQTLDTDDAPDADTITPSVHQSTDQPMDQTTDQRTKPSTKVTTDRSTVQPVDQVVVRDITTSVRLPEDLHLAVRRLLMDETRGGTLQAFFVGAAKAAIADPKIAKRVLAEMPRRGER